MLIELWSDLRYRMRALVRRDAMERELDVELAFHIENEADKYERLGVPRTEAVRRARLAFGGVQRTKDDSRDSRGTALLEAFVHDARYAARSLRKQPAFTLAVVLTLAIGIGANTTMFTLLNALMLRSLSVPHPEQLVIIGDPGKVHWGWHGSPMVDYVSYPVYADILQRNRVLSGLYATGEASGDVVLPGGAPDQPEHPAGRFVSSNFFSVLGAPVFAGRTFAGRDGAIGADPFVVISYAYWQARFGGDRSVVGSRMTINHVPLTIIGIMPPSFTGDIVGEGADYWLPITMQPLLVPTDDRITDRTASWLAMMGRLAPGVTLDKARAELSTIELSSIRQHLSTSELAEFNHDLETDPVRVESGARGFSAQRGEYRSALIVLMAAVGLVVLVVCANISNLMLARAVARTREMTVRMTLGAGRLRLIAQLMTESLLLGAAAGVLGLVSTMWATRFVLAQVGNDGASPMSLDVHPDGAVLAFTAGVTFFCVAVFGIIPALRATHVDLATSLRGQGRSVVGARARFGRILVVSQIALSMLLLVGGGLLVRSMRELLRADLGLDRAHLLIANVSVNSSEYVGPRLNALRAELAQRASGVPGVEAASYSQEGVFGGGVSLGHVDIAGVITSADSQSAINYDRVGPGYFRALGARMIRGRDFEPRDAEPGANSAVLDETMARQYFPRGNAMGQVVTLDSVSYTVVGVVHDVQEESVRGAPLRRMYLSQPEPSTKPLGFRLVIRVHGDPTTYVTPLRTALMDASRMPVGVMPLDGRIRETIIQDLLVTRVIAFFGIITLALAAIGLYGVIAYSTKQRTSEFGLRAALGAEPRQVSGIVLREGAGLAIIGVVVGLPTGLAATRLVRDRLFGVSIVDVPTLSVAAGVLVATALVASYVPARRAAKIDPLEALRAE
jgi:predicted permease